MTLHWTFISNEVTRMSSRPIGARHNLFESNSAWS